MAFERVVELYVGNFSDGNNPESKGILVSDLEIDFHVERSTTWFENKAVFRIYNASPATVNGILVGGSSMLFRAGYADEVVGNIFIGQIAYAWTERTLRGDVTTIVCAPGRGGQYQLARVKAMIKYRAGSTVREVLEGIAAFTGLALGGLGNIGDIELVEPLVLCGDVRQILRTIQSKIFDATDDNPGYGVKLYVDNNQILVFRSFGDLSELETTYLSASTGLISATPFRDEGKNQINYRQDLLYWLGLQDTMDTIVDAKQAVKDAQRAYIDASADSKTEAKETLDKANESLVKAQERAQSIQSNGREPETAEEIARRNTIQFKAMLNPAIVPNSVISINTEESDTNYRVKGEFLVEKVAFDGDNTGGEFSVSGEASK
jgi:hypothetical protein